MYAWFGDQLRYWRLRRATFPRPLRQILADFPVTTWKRPDRWFARWGDWAIFFSRLLPIVRTFISFPAGVVRTRFSTFLAFSFVGSFLWCAALTAGGFLFGARWEGIAGHHAPL